MAWALCTGCGRSVKWYAGRGCSLRELRCPVCGATLRGCSRRRALEAHRRNGYGEAEILDLYPVASRGEGARLRIEVAWDEW